MKRFRPIFPLIYVLVGWGAYATVGCEGSEENASMRVGTFDSRAVAVAYGRSEVFMNHVAGLMTEYERAKAAGDDKRALELEAEVPAEQELLEKQAFSAWPVDNILEQIEEEIPAIAENADVDAIVSKWDIVYQRSGAEFIDVTDLMVNLFDPDEETRNMLKGLMDQDPVPLEELEEH